VKLHIRLGWAAGLAGLAGMLLAGCGSVSAPPPGAAGGGVPGGAAGGGAASGGSGGTAGDPGLCPGQDVTVSLGLGQVGVAGGSALYPIDITNHSARGCRLDGYPAAWLARASGARIGTAAAPDRAVPPQPVRLAPGGSAHVWLQVGTAADYPASTCQPVTSSLARASQFSRVSRRNPLSSAPRTRASGRFRAARANDCSPSESSPMRQ